ncbi:MAG: hypothetical protein ACLF0G_09595 [Candidatus Brocadiia bacterium]
MTTGHAALAAVLALALAPPAVAGAAPTSTEAETPQAPGQQCTLSLANGDQMRGRVEKLADGVLFVYPAVAPQSLLKLELEKVEHVAFADASEQKVPDTGHMLKGRDGTLVYGRFVRLGEEAVHFQVEGIGELRFPRKDVEEVSQVGSNPPSAGGQEFCTVATVQGDLLVGDVAVGQGGSLEVSGAAVEAKVPLAAVAAVCFPVRDDDPPDTARAEGDAEKEQVLCTVATRRRGSLVGSDPAFDGSRFSLELAGGQRVSVAADAVAEASFTKTGGAGAWGRRAVLAWGAFSDTDEEFAHAVSALKDHFGSRWRIVEHMERSLDASFRRELVRSRALLVPEMESFDASAAMALAPELKKLTEGFLRRGGNVVVCGASGSHVQFLRQAGLLDVQPSSSHDGATVPFTAAGRHISRDVGESFTTANATHFYRIGESITAEAFAENPSGAPIVGRRVGRGWVILLGMDYYEMNDGMKKILVNAITHR